MFAEQNIGCTVVEHALPALEPVRLPLVSRAIEHLQSLSLTSLVLSTSDTKSVEFVVTRLLRSPRKRCEEAWHFGCLSRQVRSAVSFF